MAERESLQIDPFEENLESEMNELFDAYDSNILGEFFPEGAMFICLDHFLKPDAFFAFENMVIWRMAYEQVIDGFKIAPRMSKQDRADYFFINIKKYLDASISESVRRSSKGS